MKKIITILFFLIWLGFAVIPKPIMTAFWTLSCVFSVVFVVYRRLAIKSAFCIDKDTKSLTSNAVRLFYLSVVFFTLSFFNIPEFWGIRHLLFDTAFIARHYQIVVELFFPIAFGMLLYETNFIYKIPNKVLLVVGIYAFFLPGPWSVYLKVAALSLIAFRTNNLWITIPLYFANREQSAYALGWLFMVIVTYGKDMVFKSFNRATIKKFLAIICVIALIIAVDYSSFYEIIKTDDNTIWRWQVWTNEMQSLLSTLGTGVGFGSSFVTTDIVNVVDNSNMYKSEDGTLYEQMFLVANHNTFLDFFYRLGVIGGILFLSCYLLLFKILLRCYGQEDKQNKPYVLWAIANFVYQTFVILLNPGLEMMQFAISFCVCISMAMAIIFHCNEKKLSSENDKQ